MLFEGVQEMLEVVLPILPLRGLVVFPHTAVPLTIGQARSIRLVDEIMSGEDRLIGLVASRNPELGSARPDDLYPVGSVAVVHRMFRAPDGTIRLVVQGLVRFRPVAFVEEEPYLKAEIELIPKRSKKAWSWKPWRATLATSSSALPSSFPLSRASWFLPSWA
jgi:ATP-dependent Lon protease